MSVELLRPGDYRPPPQAVLRMFDASPADRVRASAHSADYEAVLQSREPPGSPSSPRTR
jgi:hypothetical protein